MRKKQYCKPELIDLLFGSEEDILTSSNEVGFEIGNDFWDDESGGIQP